MQVKRVVALLLFFTLIFANTNFISAQNISVELEKTISPSEYSNVFLTFSSGKYLFTASGKNKNTCYTLSVYDRETYEYITETQLLQYDGKVTLKIEAMHVKGDYLYVVYTQGASGGDPRIVKYNIKDADVSFEIEEELGIRPKAVSYIDDDIVCRTDSGYGNITFMELDSLSNISGIGISDDSSEILKSYKGLHIENNILYAYTSDLITVYDANLLLSGVSKRDIQVIKDTVEITGEITSVKGYGDYVYVATTQGVHIYDASKVINGTGKLVNRGLLSDVVKAYAIEVNNGNMYLSADGYLEIFSLTNPASPNLIYSLPLETSLYFYNIHLRPGKIYASSPVGVEIYTVNGIEISETVMSEEDDTDVDILYKEAIDESDEVLKICAHGNYLFTLEDSNVVSVRNAVTKEKITEIYKEKNGTKLSVLDLYTKNDYLYVQYSGVLRKYKISEIKENTVPVQEAVVPMFSDMSKDKATHIAETDKYIFVATGVSSRGYQSDSKILVYSKETSEYLTSIWVDTGGERDLPVRNMWTYGNTLYVSWNNAKSNKSYTGATSGNINLSRYHSPLISYNVATITKGVNLSPTVINKNDELKNLSHPYNRGGNSYLDEKNGLLYQGVYTVDAGQCYKIYDVSNGTAVYKAQLTNGSYDCTEFFVKDGYLYEILDNNGGLTLANTVSQEYNKILAYEIYTDGKIADCDLSKKGIGSYQTAVSGNGIIKDLAITENYIYVATTKGLEIVNRNSMVKTKTVSDIGEVNSLKIKDSVLFAATSNGVYMYDVSGEIQLLASFAAPSNDISVNTLEKKIYLTTAQKEGYAKVLNYDTDESLISYSNGVILEDTECFGSAIGDTYTLVCGGASKASIDTISVYNTQTGLKTVEITKSAEEVPKLLLNGNCFYIYKGTQLNCYQIPSTSSELEACLVASYASNDNITDCYLDGDRLFLATGSGIDVLNIAQSTSGTITLLKKIEESKNITSIYKNGKNIYATENTSNKLFICSADNFGVIASVAIPNEKEITQITVSSGNIFCLTDDGSVLCFETNNSIVITYNPNIKEPDAKALKEVVNEKGFPEAEYRETVYSNHSYVSTNGRYVVTSGNGNIKIFDRDINEISQIPVTSAQKTYFYGNSVIALVSSDTNKVIAYDLSELKTDVKETEIATLSGEGLIFAENENIFVYDKDAKTLSVYLPSGESVGKITDCPDDVTKIYAADGFLYLVRSNVIDLYDVNGLEDEKLLDASDILNVSFVTPTSHKITAIEAVDDYLYVAASRAAAGNRMYVYDLTEAKQSKDAEITVGYRYSTISANKGGNISHFTRCGDFLILNAQGAGELQIINIKNRLKPYRESFVVKQDNISYEDIAVCSDKIYAISSSEGLSIFDYYTVDIAEIQFVSDGEITNIPSGAKTKAQVKIFNESGQKINAKLVMAMYKGGALDNLTICDAEISESGETVCETEEFSIDSYEGITLKAMLFESFETIRPLCECSVNLNPGKAGDITLYVDPNSTSDIENGTKTAPFKTIEAAKEYIRQINKQMSGDITVELAGGRYEPDESLVFNENDSGFNGFSIIYKAKDGEKPVISGGRKIENWTLYDAENGIYKASSKDINTRQLFVNGKAAVRARSNGGLTNASCDEGELGIYCYDDFLADYKNIKDLELVFHGKFSSRRVGVDGVYKLDSSGKILLTLNRPFWQTSSDTGSYILPAYYENAYELLDEENEFYIDTVEDVIYYKPYADVNINESEVIAPVLEELIVLEGSDYYKRVKNLEFSGITFTDTTWLRPSTEGGFYPKQAGYLGVPNNFVVDIFTSIFEAVINIKTAENIKISSCEIKNSGGNGIRIIEAAENVEIIGNKITDISAGGIYIGEVNTSDIAPYDVRRRINNIKVNNNYINNIATEYYSSCAIALGTGQEVEITNNEVSNTPYTAIHIGWGWDGNLARNITGLNVSKNYIHDVVQLLGDGGAIYTTGKTMADCENNPNYISGNYIERVDGTILFAGAAIYPDTGSSGYLITNNVVDLTENHSAWIPKWCAVRENNRYVDNFATVENSESSLVTGTVVINNGVWPKAAIEIMNAAGLTEEYRYLKN